MPKVISKGCITNRDQGGGNSKCGLGKTTGFRFRSNRFPNTKTTLTKCKDKTHTFENDINLRKAVKLWLSNKRLAINIYGHISRWDVSKVKDFSYLFANKKDVDGCFGFGHGCLLPDITEEFKQYLGDTTDFDEDLSCWNVSNATNMSVMFYGAAKFNQPLNKWNVSKVENMTYMFAGATKFDQPLNKWNVGKVMDMYGMFSEATNFNKPLDKWDVSNVIDMGFMFNLAENFNQPLNNWKVSNVETMNNMFRRATAFNQPLNKWVFNSLNDSTNMRSMFQGATDFNQNLGMWCLNFAEPFNFATGSGIANKPINTLPKWNCSN